MALVYIGGRGHPTSLAPPFGTKGGGGGVVRPAMGSRGGHGPHVPPWPTRPFGLLGPHGVAGPLMGSLLPEVAHLGWLPLKFELKPF